MTTTVNLTCTVSGDVAGTLNYVYSGGAPYLQDASGNLDFSNITDDVEITITLVNGTLQPAGTTLQFDRTHDKRNFWVRSGTTCPDDNNKENDIFHNFKVNSTGDQLSFKDNNPAKVKPNDPPATFSYALRVKDQHDNWYMNDPTIKNR